MSSYSGKHRGVLLLSPSTAVALPPRSATIHPKVHHFAKAKFAQLPGAGNAVGGEPRTPDILVYVLASIKVGEPSKRVVTRFATGKPAPLVYECKDAVLDLSVSPTIPFAAASGAAATPASPLLAVIDASGACNVIVARTHKPVLTVNVRELAAALAPTLPAALQGVAADARAFIRSRFVTIKGPDGRSLILLMLVTAFGPFLVSRW